MSSKTAKKTRRRTEEGEASDFKEPLSKDDDASDQLKNGTEEDKLKGFPAEKATAERAELNGDENEDTPLARTRQSTKESHDKDNGDINDCRLGEQVQDAQSDATAKCENVNNKTVDEQQVDSEIVVDKTKHHVPEEVIETVAEEVIEISQTLTIETTEITTEEKNETERECGDLEPLVLETEEADPELDFDENSDVDSRKSSPIIRCHTRRSLTRNIPTPKTPKSVVDVNGEEVECAEKPSTIAESTSEMVYTVLGRGTKSQENEKCTAEDSESSETLDNLSTKAVAGSDITRNVDFSSASSESVDCSQFLNVSKDQTVGETLRCLSSRRSIRPATDYQRMVHQINQQRAMRAPPVPTRPSVERITGIKRKNHSMTPDSTDSTKRFKAESPGLFSYISSPILSIRSRFTRSDIPSSTPKLTGYKHKDENVDNYEVNKKCLETPNEVAEKKWCILM